MGNLCQIILCAAMNAGWLLQVHKEVNEKGFHVRVTFQLCQYLKRLYFQTASLIPDGSALKGGIF